MTNPDQDVTFQNPRLQLWEDVNVKKGIIMSKKQELNEWLAKEIMGWKEEEFPDIRHGDIEPRGYYKSWADEETGYEKCGINSWNPLEKLEQAFEIMEQYCSESPVAFHWNIMNLGEKYICELGQSKEKVGYKNISTTKPKAIIGAILKAEEVYDKFENVL